MENQEEQTPHKETTESSEMLQAGLDENPGPLAPGGIGPWPHLAKYIKYIRMTDNKTGYMFKCNYCLPRNRKFTVNTSSKFNLRRHFDRLAKFN